MNKKGLFNITEFIIFFIFIIIGAMFIVLVGFNYLNEKIETTKLETFILTKKLINSESCLAYKQDNKLQTGVVNLDRLNTNILINCYSKEGLGYVVKIKSLDGKLLKSADNLNELQKTRLPICKTIPKHKCMAREDMILYYDKGEIKTGLIKIEVINFVG
ncbi:hypothetical protein HYU23_03620 [Candidatus Woesearchaeota archaeon]|nr:hypothetical protein [Candidatus Woesearchaeota archaeon]